MREYNKLWQPSESRIEEANITQFIEHINRQGNDLKSYAELHQWSLDHNEQFWQEVWLFCDVIGNQGDTVKCQAESKWQQPVPNRDARWFPSAQINYAENLLSFAYHNPNDIAIWFENEREERQTYTWQALCDEVSSIQRWLKEMWCYKRGCGCWLPTVSTSDRHRNACHNQPWRDLDRYVSGLWYRQCS